jgi:hypothetical protein
MDQLKSLITSLGSLNSRETEAALLVDWIMERWEEIKKEVNDFNKPKDAKRRTFGKKEGELVDKLVSICNYKCDSRNRDAVNNIMITLGYVGYDKKSRFRQRMENCLKKKRKNDKSFHPSSRKPGMKRPAKTDDSEEEQTVALDSNRNVLPNSDISSISLNDVPLTPLPDDMDGYIMEDTVNEMKEKQVLPPDPSYDEIYQAFYLMMEDKPDNYDSTPDPLMLTLQPSISDDFSAQQTFSDTTTGLSFHVGSTSSQQPVHYGDFVYTDFNPTPTAMNGWFIGSPNDS